MYTFYTHLTEEERQMLEACRDEDCMNCPCVRDSCIPEMKLEMDIIETVMAQV
jgi:hypothetical protein